MTDNEKNEIEKQYQKMEYEAEITRLVGRVLVWANSLDDETPEGKSFEEGLMFRIKEIESYLRKLKAVINTKEGGE
tara:strand:- start:375 stop:602 length:228 start_codon:yes stop_codon:yes gene_type:complete